MKRMIAPVIGFAGYSGSGKTTLAVRVVALLRQRGLKVAVVKHDAHGHYKEAEGSDSALYARAGADAVVVVSPGQTVRLERTADEASLDEVLNSLREYDLVVVEGFKRERHPKIVLLEDESSLDSVWRTKPDIVAVAVRGGGSEALKDRFAQTGIPVVDADDDRAVERFVVQLLGI